MTRRADFEVWLRGPLRVRYATAIAVIVRKKQGAVATVQHCEMNYQPEVCVRIWGISREDYERLMNHLGIETLDLRDYGMGAADVIR